jgi:hypothetical protein
MGLGFNLGFALAKQVLYYLSHPSNPSCSEVSQTIPPGSNLDLWASGSQPPK